MGPFGALRNSSRAPTMFIEFLGPCGDLEPIGAPWSPMMPVAQVAWFTKLQGSKGWELRSSKNRKNNEKGLKSVTLGTSVLDIRSFKIQYPRRIRFRICNSKSDSLGPTKNDSSANNSKTA